MSQNLIEEDPSLNELAEKKKSDSLFSKKRLYYIISIVIAFVVCYLVVGFIFVNNSLSKDVISPNSIAVLPFKDFSPKDSQWFSDGVSDNILHSLAQMKDLSVISFTSSSTYRDTDKQIPEIAKELRVSYILEGSVTLVEGKIKIIAQLIDSNDKHIWSKEYNESFKDVITVQKNVAQEVMQQLEITLSPQEEVTLARFPTKNMKAYNLHLKGRLINGNRTLEDLEKNIELNKQAIALDSTFEEAYTEVAFSYYLLNYYHSNYFDPLEARHQATSYIEMALEVNPNSSKAWSVNAVLHMYVDWDKSKQYNEKAIALNPNDAISQTNYSNYFVDRPNPDIKKFLEHGIIAQRLNPLSSVTAINLFNSLLINNKLIKAENHLNKYEFLLSERWDLEIKLLAHKNKDWKTAIPFLKAKIENDTTDDRTYLALAKAYHGIFNDHSNAIIYAKKAYIMDSTNSSYAYFYTFYLINGKQYKVAKKMMESKNYKSVLDKFDQKELLFIYYFWQENSKKAQEIATDSLFRNKWVVYQAALYAQLGNRKKLDSLNKRYPWGTGNTNEWRFFRATIHAILKDRDSMYFYLENIIDDAYIRESNGRKYFDPYRNEERYKALLRGNYLPVSGE